MGELWNDYLSEGFKSIRDSGLGRREPGHDFRFYSQRGGCRGSAYAGGSFRGPRAGIPGLAVESGGGVSARAALP